jgi:hypothetical protein
MDAGVMPEPDLPENVIATALAAHENHDRLQYA